ncbi:OmpA family protein [Roseateles violae]|uniref:OmpA family protein n=1 Tax=Roseateles violae TaxID=3058042 RepID=A0ABT8DUD5_9BURK|nr:OmpA family protein [Pelomonas sp. PFR6]MDN3920640.1 OmpA family protein [Pelomonas sp. PFR6]
MKATTTSLPCLALILSLAACSSMSEREKGTATGAGIGAVAGAVIGSATGGSAGKSAAIGGALGALGGNLWSKHMEDKRRALQTASAGTGVAVERTPDNQLRLNVPSDVSFDLGRADIRPQMRPVLDEIGRNLDPEVRVTIVGHTDSSGNDGINDPLSLDRAEAVRNYLADRGVRSTRMAIEGRGSHQPVASNASEAGRAANRRVEIFLSQPSG